MSSFRASQCVNETRIPSRSNYVSLHKRPEISDAEFMKTTGSTTPTFLGGRQWHNYMQPRVVDSISCRQMYLRNAYTFSRKGTVPEKTRKCFGKVRERLTCSGGMTTPFRPHRRRTRRFVTAKKVKEFSCEAFCSIFQKLLSCTATVDVVEQNDK